MKLKREHYLIGIALLVAVLVLASGAQLGWVGAACSGSYINGQYTLNTDDSDLAASVPACAGGATGWAGTVSFDVQTPAGKIYHVRSYTAEATSVQKISCGNQDGKSDVSFSVPNEGQGTYRMLVSGISKSPAGIILPFSYSKTISMSCVLPSTKCVDGTALSTCSVNKPKYCTSSAVLVDRSSCGCPDGTQWTGTSCETPTSPDVCTNACTIGQTHTAYPNCQCVSTVPQPQTCSHSCSVGEYQNPSPDCTCMTPNGGTGTTTQGDNTLLYAGLFFVFAVIVVAGVMTFRKK